MPLLTVVAICYNHERFVRECLDGILAQTHRDYQFIVVDDGSQDGSKRIIREWLAEHRVECTFIDHEINRGLLPTLNEMLSVARGKYIAKVSTDDLWLPDKLERQLARMEALPDDVAVLYGDAHLIDEAGRRLPRDFLEEHRCLSPPSGRIAPHLVVGNFIPSLTTLVRRDALVAVGGYDERLNYEDWDMWLRLALRYRFEALGEVNACYRIVGNSLVRTGARADRPQTLMSNVLIMEKVATSALADPETRLRAAWTMDRCARELLRQRHPLALRALPRVVRARAVHEWLTRFRSTAAARAPVERPRPDTAHRA